jgi:DNA-binding NtrC family response regulator
MDDLPLLVHHFVHKAAQGLGKPAPTVPLALYQYLSTYTFPGNVRELEALMFDAVARHQGSTLALHSLKAALGDAESLVAAEVPTAPSPALITSFPAQLPTLKDAENTLIEALITEALHRAGGNQSVAAGLLGISRQALNKRLHQRPQTEGVAAPADELAWHPSV